MNFNHFRHSQSVTWTRLPALIRLFHCMHEWFVQRVEGLARVISTVLFSERQINVGSQLNDFELLHGVAKGENLQGLVYCFGQRNGLDTRLEHDCGGGIMIHYETNFIMKQ